MSEKQQDGAKTKVCCPGCGRTLGDVLESLVRQRGRFKAQREEARRERDAYKAALEEIAGNQSGTLLYVQDLARSVLAGVVSTREKDDERPT